MLHRAAAAYGASAPAGDKGAMLASAVEPMDFFGGADGLDDDVGLVDADVFDMIMHAEQAGSHPPQ